MTTIERAVPPTDMELMMLADGELDASRRAEIEAFLQDGDGDGAHGKLAGLRAVGAIVAAGGAWPERAGIDVVDALFAALDAEAAPAVTPTKDAHLSRDSKASGRERVAPPVESRPTLDGAAASLRSGSASPHGEESARPANDNGRVIFGMALAAAAAAAALFFWGKSGSEDGTTRPIAADVAVSGASSEDGVAPLPPRTAEALRADPVGDAGFVAEEARYGVEVASVDFGQRSGAIYYVPAGVDPSAAVTTVVWLADE